MPSGIEFDYLSFGGVAQDAWLVGITVVCLDGELNLFFVFNVTVQYDNKSKFLNLDILDESCNYHYYLEELVERYFINEDEIELPSQNLLECGQILFLDDRFYEIHLSYTIGGEIFNSVQENLRFSHEVS